MRNIILTIAAIALAAPAAAAAQSGGTGDGVFFPYPAAAQERREEGTVGYRVEIDRRGDLRTCEITRSSGSESLDSATCRLLIGNAKFKPRRNQQGRTVSYTHEGEIVWRLS